MGLATFYEGQCENKTSIQPMFTECGHFSIDPLVKYMPYCQILIFNYGSAILLQGAPSSHHTHKIWFGTPSIQYMHAPIVLRVFTYK